MTKIIDRIQSFRFTQTIGGEAVASTFEDVINPALGQAFQRAPVATLRDLDRAVSAARTALAEWAARSWHDRSTLLGQFADALDADKEFLATLLTLEQGKPLARARAEIERASQYIKTIASVHLSTKTLFDDDVRMVKELWQPKGIVAAIAPWNSPVSLGMVKVATALIGGNTIVIKPSEMTPLSTLAAGEIGRRIFPAGVFNVLSGNGALGRAMVEHPGFDKISFTGSTQTGISIAGRAGLDLRAATLELGGNDGAILLPDGSIADLVEAAANTGFGNCGQFCAAIKRVYVPDSMYDDVCNALAAKANSLKVGNGLESGVDIGPIQNRAQFEKVKAIVQDARQSGGRMLSGGAAIEGPGYFYPPTVVAGLTDGARLVDEEQFGPVIPIVSYSNLASVISRVNAGEYGLSCSIWTEDLDQGAKIAERIDVGTCWINQHGALDAAVPMPLTKKSGIGVDYGDWGVRGTMNMKIVNIKKRSGMA